uniref:type-4 ice-structuring protein LS-12-like n=1 Tax=Semicossyphus pulcher TaxID=241346 RepID=UPI0037E76F8E
MMPSKTPRILQVFKSHLQGAASPHGTIRGLSVLQEGTIRSKFSCRTGPVHSAAMKSASLIAAFVLVALVQGSYAQDASPLEKLTQYLEEMKTKMTQDLTELMNNRELVDTATSFIADKRTQLEPLVAQIQEQLKTVAANVEEQIQPLAANVQAQIQPMMENLQTHVETAVKAVMDKTQAIGN